METKKKTSIANLSAPADQEVATWRALSVVAAEARKRHQALDTMFNKQRDISGRLSDEKRVRLLASESAALKAEDAATAAHAAAATACTRADLAEGDADALACDPQQLRAELDERIADVERARAALLEAERLVVARIAQAHNAVAALAKRRLEAGLPPPANLPSPPQALLGESPRAWLDTKFGHAVIVKKHEARIAQLDREETQLRASLEQERLDREERASELARQEQWERKKDADHAEERARRHEAWVDARRTEQDRIHALADAHRARERDGRAS
jgi:hypothetical protein